MKVRKVWGVSFSPTGTSKKIIETIVTAFAGVEHGLLDLTCGAAAEKTFTEQEVAVIGVPVYGGRVASLAVQRLTDIRGCNTPAVLVVLYGNREYEDALIELRDLAAKASFMPVAAAAFIGEHSFSTALMPIAAGRPDGTDIEAAVSFSLRIAEKINRLDVPEQQETLHVPGNSPYKEAMGALPVSPQVNLALCTRCGLCIPGCPDGAISFREDIAIDVERCIFCCACIKTCPENAIEIAAPPLKEKRQWLHQNCGVRKEPEFFFFPDKETAKRS